MKRFAMIAMLASPLAFAGPTTTETKTETTTTTTATTETPLTVCKNLVDSATKKDFSAVQKLSLAWGGKHGGAKKAGSFEKMHKDNWSKLEKLTCANETVANDRAFVEAQAEGGKRLIPFVKTEAGWKFDAKTYMSFYDFGAKYGKKGKM